MLMTADRGFEISWSRSCNTDSCSKPRCPVCMRVCSCVSVWVSVSENNFYIMAFAPSPGVLYVWECVFVCVFEWVWVKKIYMHWLLLQALVSCVYGSVFLCVCLNGCEWERESVCVIGSLGVGVDAGMCAHLRVFVCMRARARVHVYACVGVCGCACEGVGVCVGVCTCMDA